MMEQKLDEVEQALARACALLSPERVRVQLREADPLLPPEDVGAPAGMGLALDEPRLLVSIYYLTEKGSYQAALEKLQAAVPLAGARVLSGMNGPLMFFGYVDLEGPSGRAARFKLSKIASAFAGEEE